MSKRCELQKEYYKEFGNYKGDGKYSDHYVNWLENKVLDINYTRCCKSDSEQLSCDHKWVKPIINAENKKCCKCGVWEEKAN